MIYLTIFSPLAQSRIFKSCRAEPVKQISGLQIRIFIGFPDMIGNQTAACSPCNVSG